MKDNILSVRNLSVSFEVDKQTREVVHDISFDIPKQTIFALVGESGSGKSVSANSIMRLLPTNGFINQGEILFNLKERDKNNNNFNNNRQIDLAKLEKFGKDLRKLRGNNISMIFQNPISSLNPAYSVGAQIMENILNHRKISKVEARREIIRLLEQLDINNPEQRIDQFPHEFSGGMAQRIMIAIAMSNNPDLLIADEPTTALDVTVQKQIMILLKKLCTNYQASILFITHNMGLVREYTDYIAVMYKGRIVEKAPTPVLFKNPVHPYTKALLNSIIPLGKNKNEELRTIGVEMQLNGEIYTINEKEYDFVEIEENHYVLKKVERINDARNIKVQ